MNVSLSSKNSALLKDIPRKYRGAIINTILMKSVKNGLLLEEMSLYMTKEEMEKFLQNEELEEIRIQKTKPKKIPVKDYKVTKKENKIEKPAEKDLFEGFND